ncbi:SGNH/GDSL hydrolase family protein [Larkinella soli]|uniref:SGNH/GDSL hydrolase family protein n=1 Tax=Larkinella soli TaxID=1770527 RepID=UPI000FFC979A|nr:SGNH/GDSL hydrolase family protein [Larkinella soli]
MPSPALLLCSVLVFLSGFRTPDPSFRKVEPLPKTPYVQVRGGLPNAFRAMSEKKKATVAFLGGSITFNPGWRDKVSAYLQERFPDTRFTFIKAGIPSLGSLPHAFRFQQDVAGQGTPDLLFLEAAVNDRVNETDSLTQLRALEGIVRQARRLNPDMDIVLMSFVDPDKLADFAANRVPAEIANHERVAAHYGLPSINPAREVYDRIKAGEFSWEGDFKDLHPSPFGQELYFQTIRYLLETAPAKPAGKPVSPKKTAALNPTSFDKGRYLPLETAYLQTGWKRLENWHPADAVGTRPGFVDRPVLEALTPGAVLSLPFSGSAVGMAVVSGPDAGVVEYRIDGGPYRKMDLYTQWSHLLHLPWYKLFAEDLPAKNHVLDLRISSQKNPKSAGTACRIVYFLVNG